MRTLVITKPKIKRIIICVILFLAIFFLNRMTLFTSDDFTYHFIYKGYFPTKDVERVNSLFSILTSQVNHWNLWNGRFVAHTMVQIVLMFPNIVFDILNTVAFVVLGLFVERFVVRLDSTKKQGNPELLVLIYLLLWWFLPEIGKTVLWVSGAGNYLWTSLIYLSFFYIILFKSKTSIFDGVSLGLLGFLAGGTNENAAPSVLLMGALYLFYEVVVNKNFQLQKWFSLFYMFAGFLLMMSSPGSQERGSAQFNIDFIITQLLTILRYQRSHFGILYAGTIIMLVFLLYRRMVDKEKIVKIFVFIIGHFASIYCLVFSPEIPDRVYFCSTIFLITPYLYMFFILLKETPVKFFINKVLCAGILLTTMSYCFVFWDNYTTYKQVEQQYAQIFLAKEQGVDTVVLKRLTPSRTLYNAYNGTANLGPSEQDWFNSWMAVYFGIDKIQSVD
ncbi:TPA: hypothetical protein U2D29_000808 [Streptococcus suis]|nr:hypothetical protein [Streptococcus suis]HEM6381467.1 hypothetical protein [Streptococcus suis]HEM6410798.1 hypothetical protein [Streptococcus suis]HEM6412291.1 hypothetical protein [Streptococcus suis]